MGRLFRTFRYLAAVFLHRSTPWYVKALLALSLAYVAWPIDLVPDFMLPFGWLDDLIIAPLLAALAMRFLPQWLSAKIRRNLSSRIRK